MDSTSRYGRKAENGKRFGKFLPINFHLAAFSFPFLAMKHAQGRERRHVDAKQLYDAFSFARRLKIKKRKISEKSIWVKSVSKQRRKQKGNFHSGNYEITSVAMKNTKGAFSKYWHLQGGLCNSACSHR